MFLIIGGDSEIGAAAYRALRAQGKPVAATTRRPDRVAPGRPFLDLSGPLDNWPPPKETTGVCVCAAVARIVACESDPEGTAHINVNRTLTLIDNLLARGIYVLFLSTNQVFDGRTRQVLADAPHSPIGEYGRQKARTESSLHERMARGAPIGILRLAKVASPNMPLFEGWAAELSAGRPIHAFHDMRLAPVPIELVCTAINSLLEDRASGIFQLSGPRDVTYATAARFLVEFLGAAPSLVNETSARRAGMPDAATPLHTTLDSSLMARKYRLSVPDVREIIRRIAKAGIGGRSNPAADARADEEKAWLAAGPLLIAEKTYNTNHPDYKADIVRNFPGRVLDGDQPSSNPLFLEIKKLTKSGAVPSKSWQRICDAVMAEARSVPGFDQVMERKAYIESYLAEIGQRYQAHYIAGWVNLVDAQFLYWAVRHAKPKTVVQTGVSNGLSSAFIMLALARNGPEGKLHVIDIPAVFNPDDPAWTEKGRVYGVVIPPGKSSGWIVPDIYRERFEVEIGDAKALLPPLVDRLDRIDMFFHDSDHTYNHMMFEFEQAMRKLAPNGVFIADDIAWNSSLWDFADKHHVPSYNYRGTMGAAFF